MKNNLLITVGDSWTLGVGSYPDWVLSLPEQKISTLEEQERLHDYFRENSWGKILSDRINADFLEQGRGGQSNSRIVNLFFRDFVFKQRINRDMLSKYNKKILIFLLTSPYRVSLPTSTSDSFVYSPSAILSNIGVESNFKMILDRDKTNEKKFYTYLLENHYSDDCVAWKNSLFHIEMLRFFCIEYNIDFYFATAFYDVSGLKNQLSNFYQALLMPDGINSYAELLQDDEIAHCRHPNEKGYIKIANAMYEELIKKYGDNNFI